MPSHRGARQVRVDRPAALAGAALVLEPVGDPQVRPQPARHGAGAAPGPGPRVWCPSPPSTTTSRWCGRSWRTVSPPTNAIPSSSCSLASKRRSTVLCWPSSVGSVRWMPTPTSRSTSRTRRPTGVAFQLRRGRTPCRRAGSVTSKSECSRVLLCSGEVRERRNSTGRISERLPWRAPSPATWPPMATVPSPGTCGCSTTSSTTPDCARWARSSASRRPPATGASRQSGSTATPARAPRLIPTGRWRGDWR